MEDKDIARYYKFRLPNNNDRVAILGRTGSGKTTMAAYLMGEADIHRKPWIIIDYKGEEIFEKLHKQERDAITDLEPTAAIPKRPGLYHVQPIPGQDDRAVTQMLWRIWDKQKVGIYVDEGHLLQNSDALKACLVTGRSRQIPVIMVSQRPVWVPREVFSESNHHIVFDLTHEEDRKTAGSFVTEDGKAVPRLKEFHSIWNNVRQNRRYPMAPAPPADVSVQRILDRAPRHFRWY